jgi:hypothetical protein
LPRRGWTTEPGFQPISAKISGRLRSKTRRRYDEAPGRVRLRLNRRFPLGLAGQSFALLVPGRLSTFPKVIQVTGDAIGITGRTGEIAVRSNKPNAAIV